MFDSFLIDLDGTLVDTQLDFLVAVQRTLLDFGLKPACVDAAFMRQLIGQGSDHLLTRVFERVMGAPAGSPDVAEQIAAAVPAFNAHYLRANGHYAATFQGVQQGLTELARLGRPLACVTNKPTPMAVAMLKRFDLLGHFDVVVGGDAGMARKPSPELLLNACERLGVAPDRSLMVGDSTNDAQAAAAAGCACLLVTYGYNHGRSVHTVPALDHVGSLAGVDWPRLAARAALVRSIEDKVMDRSRIECPTAP